MGDVLQSRFSALLKRSLVLKNKDPGAFVGPGVMPGIEIQDQVQPENRFLRGERLWAFGFDQSVTVTQFNLVTISNPASNNRIAVLRRIRLSGFLPTSGQQSGATYFFIYRLFSNTGGLPPPVAANTCDGRVGTAVGQSWVGSNANNSNIAIVVATEAPKTILYWSPGPIPAAPTAIDKTFDNLDIVISPGTELRFGWSATALATSGYTWVFNAEGYERVLDASELTGPP